MRWIRCEEGVNTKERIAVTGDVLNIVGRLKEIDEDYFVMFNRLTQKFEVHVRGQLCTIGCELPFDRLDARAISYVREHHSSRMDEIMKKIDEEETRAELARAKQMDELRDRLADGLAYAAKSRTSDDFPDEAAEGIENESETHVRAGSRVHRQERRLCNHHGRGRQGSV